MYKGVNGQNYQIPQLAVPVKYRLDQLLDRKNVWPYITDHFYAIIYMKPYPDYIDRDHPGVYNTEIALVLGRRKLSALEHMARFTFQV